MKVYSRSAPNGFTQRITEDLQAETFASLIDRERKFPYCFVVSLSQSGMETNDWITGDAQAVQWCVNERKKAGCVLSYCIQFTAPGVGQVIYRVSPLGEYRVSPLGEYTSDRQ